VCGRNLTQCPARLKVRETAEILGETHLVAAHGNDAGQTTGNSNLVTHRRGDGRVVAEELTAAGEADVWKR
jgi:hypothetical protein